MTCVGLGSHRLQTFVDVWSHIVGRDNDGNIYFCHVDLYFYSKLSTYPSNTKVDGALDAVDMLYSMDMNS